MEQILLSKGAREIAFKNVLLSEPTEIIKTRFDDDVKLNEFKEQLKQLCTSYVDFDLPKVNDLYNKQRILDSYNANYSNKFDNLYRPTPVEAIDIEGRRKLYHFSEHFISDIKYIKITLKDSKTDNKSTVLAALWHIVDSETKVRYFVGYMFIANEKRIHFIDRRFIDILANTTSFKFDKNHIYMLTDGYLSNFTNITTGIKTKSGLDVRRVRFDREDGKNGNALSSKAVRLLHSRMVTLGIISSNNLFLRLWKF